MADPHWGYVSSLLHFDGANNSTTFTDEKGNTITANGNVKISTTQSKFGGSSGYFDGSGDYLTFAFTGFLTGNFTAECWIYPTVNSGSYKTLFNIYSNGAGLYQINDTIVWWEASGPRCTSASITMNAWHHVAATRTGMIVDVWVDGVKSATSYTSSLSYGSGTIYIGCGSSSIEPYTGYIDDFRLTLGTRYTANFTPPSSAFEHGDGSSIIYSLYSDRLTIAPNPPVGRYTERVLIEPGLTTPSYYDGGTGIVAGTVTYNGTLAKRKVSLFTLKDKRLVEETWSDPVTGEYSFDRLKDQEYFVWSEDYLRVFDAETHLVATTQG